MSTYPALFLDRDGVIIENRADYVRSWDDVEFFPEALQALAHIRYTEYKIIIVTNQSVVGRGIITLEMAQAINNQLVEEIEGANGRIDALYMCPHAPRDNCPCRKPRPGLVLQATADHAIDLSRSIMIGDALTDIAAGQAAGVAQTMLLRTGRGAVQAQLPQAVQYTPFTICNNLHAAFIRIGILQ